MAFFKGKVINKCAFFFETDKKNIYICFIFRKSL